MKLKNKQKIILIILIFLMISIIVSAFLTFKYINDLMLSTIFLFVFIICFIILLKLKGKFDYLNYIYKYENLIEKRKEPIKLKNKVSLANVTTFLKNSNYKLNAGNDNYKIFYKISTIKNKQIILHAFLIILNNNEFENVSNNDYFQNLEKNISEKLPKVYHRQFFQIKLANINEDLINSANKVFFVPLKKAQVILLNLIFDENKNQLYYLNAGNDNPNGFYNLAIAEISNIFK